MIYSIALYPIIRPFWPLVFMPNHHQDFLPIIFVRSLEHHHDSLYSMRITHQFFAWRLLFKPSTNILFDFLCIILCIASLSLSLSPLYSYCADQMLGMERVLKVISHWIDSRERKLMNLRNESGKGRIREKEGGNINKRHVFAVKRCRLLIQEPIIGSDALLIDGYGGRKEPFNL